MKGDAEHLKPLIVGPELANLQVLEISGLNVDLSIETLKGLRVLVLDAIDVLGVDFSDVAVHAQSLVAFSIVCHSIRGTGLPLLFLELAKMGRTWRVGPIGFKGCSGRQLIAHFMGLDPDP